MATLTEADIKASIKNKDFKRSYYFYGKNSFEIENIVKLITLKSLNNSDPTYNYHKFEGKDIDISKLEDVCDALPVFSDYVCCCIEDLNAESLNSEQIKKLTNIINNLSDTTILIFFTANLDVCDGRRYPTIKNKKIIDAVNKEGITCICANKTPAEISKYIITRLSKSGCQIDKNTAIYLSEICLCNLQIINNEIDKLASYSQGKEIDRDTIDLLCPRQLEAVTFDIAKAIAKGDRKKAIFLLNELVDLRIEPISILYAIISSITDLYRSRVAINNRKSTSDVCKDFNYPKNMSFKIDYAFRDVSNLTVNQLREFMKILSTTDISMKSVKTDGVILLQEAIIKMMSVKK